jgi:DNA-binding response OmpR family regulator
VVESDSGFRGLLQNGFRRAGYDVLIAANAQHGMRIAALHWPDAALIEVQVPGLAGLELFESLRSYSTRSGGGTFPAWMMVRDTTPELTSRGLGAGAVGIINKPFSPAEIVSIVGTHFSTAESPAPLLRARKSLADNVRSRLSGTDSRRR